MLIGECVIAGAGGRGLGPLGSGAMPLTLPLGLGPPGTAPSPSASCPAACSPVPCDTMRYGTSSSPPAPPSAALAAMLLGRGTRGAGEALAPAPALPCEVADPPGLAAASPAPRLCGRAMGCSTRATSRP